MFSSGKRLSFSFGNGVFFFLNKITYGYKLPIIYLNYADDSFGTYPILGINIYLSRSKIEYVFKDEQNSSLGILKMVFFKNLFTVYFSIFNLFPVDYHGFFGDVVRYQA